MFTQGDPLKVLVVDDSAFMRKSISTMLSKSPEINVVGTARDGQEALRESRRVEPGCRHDGHRDAHYERVASA